MDSSSSPFSTWIENLELDLDERPTRSNAGSTVSGSSIDVDKWIDDMALSEQEKLGERVPKVGQVEEHTHAENVESSRAEQSENEEDIVISYYSSLVTPKKLTFEKEICQCQPLTSLPTYIHVETLDVLNKSIHFGRNGEIHMYKGDYLVEQPLVVEPSELDSPFVLSSDSGRRIVMLVIPTEYSYGSVTLAISAKGIERFDKEELPRFVDHMRGVIKQSAGSNNRAKQQHYGYLGNNRVEGPWILTVMTKDEVRDRGFLRS
jgi:hypothetical protein